MSEVFNLVNLKGGVGKTVSTINIYKMISTEGQKSLDMKFQRLPIDHPARAPYGIFKQAASNLWGNIFIGLGSRLSVFQNKLVDTITKYHEIDMELPGKQPCAYFCIISAQDSAYEFLSSLFFSLLFKRLYPQMAAGGRDTAAAGAGGGGNHTGRTDRRKADTGVARGNGFRPGAMHRGGYFKRVGRNDYE